MKFLEQLKLDRWYRIVFLLGVLMMIGSVLHEVKFLENKHLFGFGLGLVILGIGFLISERTAHQFGYGGIFSWGVNQHNFITILLIIIGICLMGTFGYLIVQSLV